MSESANSESFRLSTGGLFYSLLTRLHIQRPDEYSTRRKVLLLTALCWLPLAILTAMEGNAVNAQMDLPLLHDIKTYARFFIILPLLVIADSLIDPLVASNLQSIGASGLIRDEHQGAYQNAIEKFRRRKDSYLADIVILLSLALIITTYIANVDQLDAGTFFTNWIVYQNDSEIHFSKAGLWFTFVSAPVLLILLFRWVWRFYLWSEFLFRVSRIPLRLQPTHPDLAGGLGILKNGENSFLILFFSFGAMFSTSLAEEILYSDMTLTESQPVIGIFLLISVFLMTLPLLFFIPQLVRAKRRGRVTYGNLGYRLSEAFDKKWGKPMDKTVGEQLLETADASAVCDYSDVFEVVREMRYLPITLKNYVQQAILLALPFFPLVFTEIPVAEVISRLIHTLI